MGLEPTEPPSECPIASAGRAGTDSSSDPANDSMSASESAADRPCPGSSTAATRGSRAPPAPGRSPRLGDHLPKAALQPLAEARDRASEISADVLALPWDRSVLGFAWLTLRRIGLAP
ncbi:hypothetical protein [Sphaerimonospora mesophila]|uniref:hypothetical protein n=1 Tax=Sphaerimonospora mesophila TaxID=37483 RepID=UPI0006E2EFD7